MSFDFPCPCCRYYTVRYPDGYEQCPVCGWTDTGACNDDRSGSVLLDQAQRNFQAFGACWLGWHKSVTPPPSALRRAPLPFTIDEWKHALPAQFIERARRVFGNAKRPRYLTSPRYDHEIEYDYDGPMQSFDNDTLTIAPLLSVPLDVLVPSGFRYFMPGLIRIQIEALLPDAEAAHGWRMLCLLVHLCDAESKQFSLFEADEIQLVADLYQAILRCPGFASFFSGVTGVQGAAQAWLKRATRQYLT